MSAKGETQFHVNEKTAGQTLAAALRHWMPGKSWNEVRGLITKRRVQVSGNLCVDAARRLTRGEVVKLAAVPLAKPPEAETLKLRYLDENIVVVEKPAGVTTVRHPEEKEWPADRKQLQPTLDEMLPKVIQREERTNKRGPHYPRVRAVHRLDRETSGLMVFARTVPAERNLVVQFKKHTIHRLYLAIVAGVMEQPRTIESVLVRDRGDGRRGSAPRPGLPGKRAVTHITPLETRGKFTLVECRLETGRTHQIRIHLAESGHPVLGERVYQPKEMDERKKSPTVPRVMLHAAELGFVHPIHGNTLRFAMPLPADIQEVWDQLAATR